MQTHKYSIDFAGYIKYIYTASLKNMFYIAFVAMFLGGITGASAQVSYTINKTHNAPTPIQSGQPFTYTITYSWSGGAPGTLYIVDNIPSTLDVISALPSSPISNISGNQVTFALSGLTLPSGSGTVQINVRFKPGVTCGGDRACNIAGISDRPDGENFVYTEESCVTAAEPENKWQFKKELIAGCALDDEVIFRISVINPSGSDIGGVNLTNVSLQDFLPLGAEIVDVTGNWTGPTNTTSNGVSWIPLTGGPTTLTVSPYTLWRIAYVKVKFPSTLFNDGQVVENIAKLEFNTPCDQNTVTWQDTASVTLCQGINQGNLNKWLTLGLSFPSNPYWQPVFTPGCCGTYRMRYQNSGTLAQNNFVMEDDVPGEVDVNSIRTQVPSGSEPVTLEIFTWSGGSCSSTPSATFTYTSSGTFVENTLPSDICKVKWSYNGTIGINDYIYNSMDVCVRSTNLQTGAAVTPGQTIQNTATVSATGLSPITVNHNTTVDATQPKVVATKLFIGDCNNSCQVQPGGPYQPGDTVRFRMAVANIGNADATTASITDNLPSGLSYVGNETYYYDSFNWMANIYNPPCCSLTAAVPSEIGGSITTPNPGDTNLTWTFPVLPARCDGTVEYFILDFDVVISSDPPAEAGQYPNTFDFDASNVPTVTSNVAFLTVNATAQLQALKEVREQGSSGAWLNSANIEQGGSAEYKLTVINTGNTQLTDLCVLDIMPWVGDIKVLPGYTARGSSFDLPYNPSAGAITTTPTGFSTSFNNIGLVQSQNPSRASECGGFCGVTDPSGAVAGTYVSAATQTHSFKINANSGINLAPGGTFNAIVPVDVAGNIPEQEKACNSFAIQAVPQGLANVCLSAESNNACIVVKEKEPCFDLGDYRLECISKDENGNWIYALNFSITNNSGQNGTIQVIANNGTVSNVTPLHLQNGVPTNVTANYTPNQAPGGDCFTVVLFAGEGNNEEKLCDTTFCLEYDVCSDPCPCPLEIKIDRSYASQASGNQVWVNSLFNIGGGIQNIKATIVSAQVNQYCWFGGSTSYNSAAVFNSAQNWGPVVPSGTGTAHLEWTNLQCPPLNNFSTGMFLEVPNAPGFFCKQTVNICIRYEFTDCKCQTCDTTVCYRLTRKRLPIIIWGDHKKDKKIGGIIKQEGETAKGDELQNEHEDEGYAEIEMSSTNEGVLTIANPLEDEFTYGITIHSIEIASSIGVQVADIIPQDGNWSDPQSTETGLMIEGDIEPGETMKFDLKYENVQAFNKWVNTLTFGYTLNEVPDTLYGSADVISRVPGALGGDILENQSPGMDVENARTFALRFINANNTLDSINKVVLRLEAGMILAAGPGLSDNEFVLEGVRTSEGEITLLASPPDAHTVASSALPAGSVIGPIYVTVASEDPESVMMHFTTYSVEGDVISEGTIELTNPVLGIEELDNGMIDYINSYVYPNPAQDKVNFKFSIAGDENVSFHIRDMKGRIVTTLLDSKLLLSGEHSLEFKTEDMPAGTYFYTIEAGKETQSHKFVIVK